MTNALRLQSAFKLALAIVLAYWITLYMDWGKPYWAGISIVACSLTSLGESINKGLLRLGGTCLAILVSITLLALFGQERWLFVGALGLWLGICAFMMCTSARFYFWKTAGFVVPILVIGGGNNPVVDFSVMTLRAQQTVLGILCFTLVYAILWPVNTRALFKQGVSRALAVKRRMLAVCLDILDGKTPEEDLPALRIEIAEGHAKVENLLAAAVLDSYHIWDQRKLWRSIVSDMASMDRVVQRLCLEVNDIKDQPATEEVARIRLAILEADDRLKDAQSVFSGQEARPEPKPIDLEFSEDMSSGVTHFERAARAVVRNQAGEAIKLGTRIFEGLAAITGQRKQSALPAVTNKKPYSSPLYIFDPDIWAAVLRVQVIFFALVLSVFFIPGFPSEAVVIPIGVSTAMALVRRPHVSISGLMVIFLLVITCVGTIHIMALPRLDAFWQLAILLFGSSFAITYFTDRPEQAVLRTLGLNLFLVGLQTDNEQQYSFMFFALLTIGVFCVLAIVELTRFYPVSFRPEWRTEALIKRFFASAEYVVRNSLSYDDLRPTLVQRLLLRHHLSQIDRIPAKLVPWLRALPKETFNDTGKQDAHVVAASLEALSSRIFEFVDARQLSQSDVLVARGGRALKQWRLAVADSASDIFGDPGAAQVSQLSKRVRAGTESLEEHVRQLLNETSAQDVSPSESDNMYRILGAYRGLASGVIGYAQRAALINWPKLRESRF